MSALRERVEDRRRAGRIGRMLRKMDRLSTQDAVPDRERRRGRAGGHFVRAPLLAVVAAAALVTVPVAPKTPLGQPPAVASGQGVHSFMHVQPGNGAPVGYDPCEPIRYVVDEDLAPAGAAHLVDEAIAEVSLATGLVFEHVGEAGDIAPAEPPRRTFWTSHAPPVRIAWSTPQQVPELEGSVLGIGGSVAYGLPGGTDWRLTTGEVHLDAPELAEVLTREGGETQVRMTIMHELAHLVGLGHVDDPSELMHEHSWFQTGWGPGDREGLAALGAGRCFGLRPVVDVGWSLPLGLI